MITRQLLTCCMAFSLAMVAALALAGTAASAATPPGQEFRTIEWTDLIPPDVLEVLMNPPSYINEIEDGSMEDQISSQMKGAIASASDDRYQQALVSTKVIDEMDGARVRIPGFIVPLEFDEEQTVTQFFLVPYFGACLHMPPPPPNQIILVNSPQGLPMEDLYVPFWIAGEMTTSLTENDMATSAYAMKLMAYEVYSE